MLVDAQGNRLDAIRKAAHWRLFEALQQNAMLFAPLRDAVNACVSAIVSDCPQGKEPAVDSTAVGPLVFSRLGARWPSEYGQWHALTCSQNLQHEGVNAERMYGMMLWYVLAAERPERWLAPPQGEKRVYRLDEPTPEAHVLSVDRQMLVDLRHALREQVARLDRLLGD
jgi:hypothetical protein